MTDFAKDVQERRKSAEAADDQNRKEMLIDLQFAGLDQWDSRVKSMREERGGNKPPLPCLTIDTTNQLVGQVVGDRRANQTSIKVLPREDGDKEVAEIRSELIRSIELQSKAQRVYAQAFEQAVMCGQGAFRIDLDYAYEDAFERDIFIRSINNPLAVLWDPLSGDVTGRDAEFCFVEEMIQKEDYKARFNQEPSDLLGDSQLQTDGWVAENTVRIAEYWQMTEKPKTVAMLADGSVMDVTGIDTKTFQLTIDPQTSQPVGIIAHPETKQPVKLMINPSTGEPYVRETQCKYATRTLTNGKEPLEDPLELKLPRLPIIKVTGREVWVADKRVRFGLIRAARDQQRLKNYLRSVAAEKLMFAPRHSYLVEQGSITGMERDYGSNVLEYKKGATPPQEATLNNLQALVQMSEMFAQDMKDVTGIHDASLGVRSNETSGVAIRARQGEGDIATVVYHDHMNESQCEAGEVINALIPIAYDTARTLRLIGADDSIRLLRVNDPGAAANPQLPQDKNYDLSLGRYDIQVTTGAHFETKRAEDAANLMELANKSEAFASVVPDLIVKALDIRHADEMAERLKRTVPQHILGDEEEETEEQKAEKQEAAQLQKAMAKLAYDKADAEARKAVADAVKAEKEAQDALAGLNKQTVDATNAETARLKAVTAKDFPLPASAQAILAPIVTQAVMNVLQSPDVLPLSMSLGIAAEAHDDAINQQAINQLPPEQPGIEGVGQ